MDDLRDRLILAYDRGAEAREHRQLPVWKALERQGFLSEIKSLGRTRLLEVGAGVGRDGAFFQDAGCEVTCIDLSPNMVARCRDKGLRAEVMDVGCLAFEDESFDAVYSFNSLLHLRKSELPAVLREIHRVLAPEGLFYFGTYGGFDHEGVHEDDDHVPPRFFSFYDDDHLTQVVSSVFNVIELRSLKVNGQDERFRFQALLVRKPLRIGKQR